ncbi:TonB-dependent receptor [Pedobacter sp. HDW13]|uniref:TonB-dependent siderophore receptor n=1 Tax=unclassified Pedobacter TaxID=2628915 RepID=UPI000F59ABD1|nr:MULTISPECIES: TonB-dependent siderophore receptor [unclassified Pedobacter]QIL42127.1 TonB-dependent receptor [Pedobacter sp. HDW13]RQO76639.1 TonB-dependent siderophore receptor [Pedobacter sp. KBW01]
MKLISAIFRIIFIIVLFQFISFHIMAQVKVSGKVIDANHQAINKANIKFKSGKDQLNTSTDSLGNFALILPKTASYTLSASAIGYTGFTKNYLISNDINIEPITLQSSNEELQTVEVIGTNSRKYYGNYSFSATKTATANKDIPQAISSVSKELMADRQAAVLADAVKNITSVSQSSYYNQFAIRGINQNEEGAIINGMRTRQYYFNQPLTNNLERIEVIKGPASATFSSVDPGGSINLVTKKPLTENRKEVSISTGSFSTIRGALDFTGPLNTDKTLLYRLNIGYEDGKSFRNLQYRKGYIIAPSFSYRPSDRTSLNVEVVMNNSNSRLDRGQAIFGAIAGQTDLNSTPITFNMGASNDRFNTQDLMLMTSFSHQLSKGIAFNAAYMKQNWNEDLLEHRTTNAFGVDENNQPIPTLAAMRAVQRQQKWGTDNLSTYFSINTRTFSISHKLVIGYDRINTQKLRGGGENSAQGYRLKDGTIATRYDPAKKDLYLFKTINGVNAPVPNVEHFNLANPAYTLKNLSDYTFTKTEIPPSYYLVNGIYVQDQLTYGKLTLTLGLRQEWYKDYSNYQLATEKRIAQHKLLPRAGITYALNPNINIYATYLQGYQPQGNTSSLVIIPPPAGTNFKPLESDLREIGAKSEWLNRRLMINVALFEINQKNLLMNANDPLDVNRLVERGAQRSRGFEFEASGLISANWQFNAGYSYIDAIIKDDFNPQLIGQRVQNTPKHSASLWTRYNLETLKLKGIGFGAGVQYSGTKLPLYIRDFELPAYTLFDAAIYYSPVGSKVQLAANLNNILNKTYWVGAQNYLRLFPGTPRNIMFNVTYRI